MFDFENNFHKIYENHVLTALKLTKFYKASNVYNPQIIFVGKTYRFLYWFPTKIHKTYKKSKAPLIKVAVTHSSYSFFKIPDPLFFKIHLLSYYGLDASEVFSTPEFSNFIFNYNESIKQQEFKRRLPKLKRTVYLPRPFKIRLFTLPNYFFTMSEHRRIFRLYKSTFLSINKFLKKNWLLAKRSVVSYLRLARPEDFAGKFIRWPGMSLDYWFSVVFKMRVYNHNSYNILADIDSNSFFQKTISRLIPQNYLKIVQLKPQLRHLSFSAFFFLFEKFVLDTQYRSYYENFSSSYYNNNYATSAPKRFNKHYFSTITPRFARILRLGLEGTNGLVRKLRTNNFLLKPTFWNFKLGLDSYPNEYWEFEDVSWWEDHIVFYYLRFHPSQRKAVFKGYPSSHYIDNIWLYKNWFHENMYLEFISSYYKSYYNFNYLLEGGRYNTDYPKKYKNRFDIFWQERIHEFLFHIPPDYCYPSTTYYLNFYSASVATKDLESFIMLNFSWKFSKKNLFYPFGRRKLSKSLVGRHYRPDKLRPDFYTNYRDFTFSTILMPLSFFLTNTSLLKDFSNLQKNFSFLLNFFYKSTSKFQNSSSLLFLYYFLKQSLPFSLSKTEFFNLIDVYFLSTGDVTFASFYHYLIFELSLNENDLALYKERVFVEYIAFQRLYNLFFVESTINI